MKDGCWELIIMLPSHDRDGLLRARVTHALEAKGYTVVEGMVSAADASDVAWHHAPLMIYCSTEQEALACAAHVRNINSSLQTQVRFLSAASWNAVWEQCLQSFSTPHFFVTSEEQPRSAPDKHMIRLYPSEAFGDGRHVTTRVILALLDDMWSQRLPASFLDVGCGNGVLAIAAGKMGVQHIAATDVVEEAIVATREHALLNHVNVEVRLDDNPDDGRTWDCIAANIPAAALIPLLPALRWSLKPGGALVLAGFFNGDAAQVLAAAQPLGLRLLQERNENDWLALHLAAF